MAGIPLSLEGKVALVTGGSRGIGAATVRMFRQAGARVAFSYEKARATAEALAAELGSQQPGSQQLGSQQPDGQQLGGQQAGTEDLCRALQQPLATPADGRALIAATVAAFGRLDCLIVNHGVWPAHDQPIASMPDAQWRGTLAINLDSVFGLVQAGVAQMLSQPLSQSPSQTLSQTPAQPDAQTPSQTPSQTPAHTGVRGHIVLIASTAAQRGEAFHADYAASKGALIALTKSLSSELAPQGIYANCVAPGWVATEMSLAALEDPAVARQATSLIPLGRIGHVDEIAGPILFLCTPLAGFVSGEIFNVNGGAVLVG